MLTSRHETDSAPMPSEGCDDAHIIDGETVSPFAYLSVLDSSDAAIVRKIAHGETQTAIAREMGVSRTEISNRYRRAIGVIRDKFLAVVA